LFQTLAALLALETGVREPLDADSVANLDRRVDGVRTNGNDLTNTFMPTNEWELVRQGPVPLAGVQVRVAHAGTVHLNETLSRGELLGLLHRMVILDKDGRIGRYDESSLLGFGDANRHYGGREYGYAEAFYTDTGVPWSFGAAARSGDDSDQHGIGTRSHDRP